MKNIFSLALSVTVLCVIFCQPAHADPISDLKAAKWSWDINREVNVPVIQAGLESDDPKVFDLAIDIVYQMRGDAEKILEDVLLRQSPDLQAKVFQAIFRKAKPNVKLDAVAELISESWKLNDQTLIGIEVPLALQSFGPRVYKAFLSRLRQIVENEPWLVSDEVADRIKQEFSQYSEQFLKDKDRWLEYTIRKEFSAMVKQYKIYDDPEEQYYLSLDALGGKFFDKIEAVFLLEELALRDPVSDPVLSERISALAVKTIEQHFYNFFPHEKVLDILSTAAERGVETGEYAEVRRCAVLALSHFRGEKGVNALVHNRLADPSSSVALAAAKVQWGFWREFRISAIETVLYRVLRQTTDLDALFEAVDFLVENTNNRPRKDELGENNFGEMAEGILIKILSDENPEVRGSVFMVLFSNLMGEKDSEHLVQFFAGERFSRLSSLNNVVEKLSERWPRLTLEFLYFIASSPEERITPSIAAKAVLSLDELARNGSQHAPTYLQRLAGPEFSGRVASDIAARKVMGLAKPLQINSADETKKVVPRASMDTGVKFTHLSGLRADVTKPGTVASSISPEDIARELGFSEKEPGRDRETTVRRRRPAEGNRGK